jgi:hypothetical protein
VQKIIDEVLRATEEGSENILDILEANQYWEYEKYQKVSFHRWLLGNTKQLTKFQINLIHWGDVLDKFDEILEEAEKNWFISKNENVKLNTFCGESSKLKFLVGILKATECIISHAYNKVFYASIEVIFFQNFNIYTIKNIF